MLPYFPPLSGDLFSGTVFAPDSLEGSVMPPGVDLAPRLMEPGAPSPSRPSALSPYEDELRRAREAEDAANARQIAAMRGAQGIPGSQIADPAFSLKDLLIPGLAALATQLFDKSGETGKGILGGFVQGRTQSADVRTRQSERQRQERLQNAQIEGQIAGLESTRAGRRTGEAQTALTREEQRLRDEEEKKAENARNLKLDNEAGLRNAQTRYGAANTEQEKRQAGKSLQRFQEAVGEVPMSDDEIAADVADIVSGRLATAQDKARKLIEPHLKHFGHIPEESVPEIEAALAALAADYKILDAEGRPDWRKILPGGVPTFETLVKQKFERHKMDVDRTFKHLQEKDREMLALTKTRIAIAQEQVKIARERLLISKDMTTISAYNAATARLSAEIREGKEAMAGMTSEKSSIAKLAQKIRYKQADFDAIVNQDEPDEEQVARASAELAVMREELESMQDKVLVGMGVDYSLAGAMGDTIGMGSAVKQGIIDNRQPTSGNGKAVPGQPPAGPSVGSNRQDGGASSKVVSLPDGSSANVQEIYEAAQKAIAAKPESKKAIIERYQTTLKNAGVKDWKWPA